MTTARTTVTYVVQGIGNKGGVVWAAAPKATLQEAIEKKSQYRGNNTRIIKRTEMVIGEQEVGK